MSKNLMKTKLSLQNLIYFLFPILKLDDFHELVNGDLVLSKNQYYESILSSIVLYLIYFLVVITGFRIPIFQYFHAICSPNLGKVGQLIYFEAAVAMFEISLMRLLIFFKLRIFNSPIEIDFVQLILEARKHVQRKMFLMIKILLPQTQIGSYFCVILVLIAGYYDKIEFSRLIFWTFCYIHLIRTGILHVPALLAFTIAGSSVLNDEINEIKSLIESDSTKLQTNHLLSKYLHYINSVRRLNSLTKHLLFIGNLFNIPFMSLLFCFILVPTKGTIMEVLRIIFFISALFYGSRVYILTIILSKVDGESKLIHSKIYSAISRGKVANQHESKRLLYMMEDLASERNHFVVKGYNNTITQMDTFNNIISTLLIVSLFFSSQELVEKFVGL